DTSIGDGHDPAVRGRVGEGGEDAGGQVGAGDGAAAGQPVTDGGAVPAGTAPVGQARRPVHGPVQAAGRDLALHQPQVVVTVLEQGADQGFRDVAQDEAVAVLDREAGGA